MDGISESLGEGGMAGPMRVQVRGVQGGRREALGARGQRPRRAALATG